MAALSIRSIDATGSCEIVYWSHSLICSASSISITFLYLLFITFFGTIIITKYVIKFFCSGVHVTVVTVPKNNYGYFFIRQPGKCRIETMPASMMKDHFF